MDARTINRRLRAVRALMGRARISNLLLTGKANVSYTTGFMGDDSWSLITANRVYLLTDSRYTEQAAKECPSCRIAERKGTLARTVGEILGRTKSGRTLAVEQSTSIAVLESLNETVKGRIKAAPTLIERVRRTKDTGELAAIRSAASRSNRALKAALAGVRVGMSESELAGLLDFEMRKLDSTTSFETIVAFGANASRPHHQPSNRKLRSRDSVLIDFGARYKGYCSDITRCFAVGGATKLYERVFETVERAQASAIAAVRAGVRVSKVDAAARRVVAESGLPVYGHGTGHGFGLEIHEGPFMKPDTAETLQEGDVITVEPGVYMPGKLGVRIEDDVLVTAAGCKLLTGACRHRIELP